MRKIFGAVIAVSTMVGLCGCGPTYYRVTDPTTNRAYYTTEMKEKGAGSVQLRDAGTGKTVTLQNSEVQKVTREQFETGKVRSTLTEPEGAGAPVFPSGYQSNPPKAAAPAGRAAVEGIVWQLVEIGGQPAEPVPADDRPTNFRLNTVENRVSGYGGVNRLSGPYELNGNALRFGMLSMTRRAGPEPLMHQESELSRAMEQTASWRSAASDEIELLDATGKSLARFKSVTP